MNGLATFRAQYPEYDDLADQDLVDRLYKKYYSDLDRDDYYKRMGFDPSTDYLELSGEVGKGLARGFGSGLLSAGAGLAELADVATDFVGLEGLIDSGDENELIRLANEGKQALNESMGVGRNYRDNYLVKLGEGLGSIGSFFVPGGAFGLAGKVAGGARAAKIAGMTGAIGAGAVGS